MKAIAIAVALAVAIAVGCGSDDEETTVTETTGVETEETGEEVRTPLPVKNEGPARFQSPSGNIGCALGSDGVRCDIQKRDWEPPAGDPAEKNCELDFGHGISLDDTHAGFVCAGDTTLGFGKTLPYGAAAQRGVFRCESSEREMLCFNVESGTGFSLSRQSYRIF